jgi:cbb3-type cytochrome oxidase maturation protein
MTALAWLVPVALFLGGLGLCAFLWSLRSGQYDDLEGAGWRALDDERPVDAVPASATSPPLADKAAGNDMMVRR